MGYTSAGVGLAVRMSLVLVRQFCQYRENSLGFVIPGRPVISGFEDRRFLEGLVLSCHGTRSTFRTCWISLSGIRNSVTRVTCQTDSIPG